MLFQAAQAKDSGHDRVTIASIYFNNFTGFPATFKNRSWLRSLTDFSTNFQPAKWGCVASACITQTELGGGDAVG